MRAALVIMIAALSACSALPMPGASVTQVSVTPDAQGLQPAGTELRIDFGRAQDGVIETVSRLLGTAPRDVTTNDECGAGSVTAASWSNGLTLNFLDGDFLGWVVSEPDLPVDGGLRVGMEPPATPMEDTSLGREFEVNGVWALVQDAGTITTLWSGTTCFFR